MKRKQLEDLGRDLLDFSKFPKVIKHKKLNLAEAVYGNLVWEDEDKDWILCLEPVRMKGNHYYYRISYVLYEGITQFLPAISAFEGGICKETPWECIRKMKEWLKEEGLLSVEN